MTTPEQPSGDHIDAIAIGIETLGFNIGTGLERRAKASMIEQALKLCSFSIVPFDERSIPVKTLKWWRELVDLNPGDLAPRLDAVIAKESK